MASMQPGFDAAWGGDDGMYAQRLGPERARWLNRFADLAAAGVPLAFGSDAPVTELGPWAAVRAAMHPADPAAAIGADAAFAAHTAGGWRAAGRPEPGVLIEGAPATFAVWDVAADDLFDLAPGQDLPTCRATVLNGTPIYDTGLIG
jgi:predicted amidohydrolase YtcJ